MNRAVVYGGGNIGRGFIGVLLHQSGYHVTFIDVAKELVNALHHRGQYPVRILSNAGSEDIVIDQIDAIDGSDGETVAAAIAKADIMATAVGAGALKHIAPHLTAGLCRRFAVTNRPLNIIICENLPDADKLLAAEVEAHLTHAQRVLFHKRVGLVEASIGRMVPVQTASMQDGDPLRICAEGYDFLPVDADAFKGEIPAIKGLVPYTPFRFYLERKLFIHNLGHCVCACLGLRAGYDYIWQAIEDAEILLITKNAMLESAQALAQAYGVPMQTLMPHVEDLLLRFKNRALGDTCKRVANDPARKLSRGDRLIGAATLCMAHDVSSHYIEVGIAAALHHYLMEEHAQQSVEHAKAALQRLSQLDEAHMLTKRVLNLYRMLLDGANPKQLRTAVETIGMQERKRIV